jgi:4-hydroxy-2-oxoheptanedioate aldolase
MAEHVRAIEQADQILSVPGIDVIFIGPNDLHHSMGRPPAFESDHPPFVQAVQHILKTARRHGVAPGIHVADAASARRRLDEGFQFVAIASEAGMMLSKAQEIATAVGLGGEKPAVAKY